MIDEDDKYLITFVFTKCHIITIIVIFQPIGLSFPLPKYKKENSLYTR